MIPPVKLQTAYFDSDLISLGGTLISPPPDSNCLQKKDRFFYPSARGSAPIDDNSSGEFAFLEQGAKRFAEIGAPYGRCFNLNAGGFRPALPNKIDLGSTTCSPVIYLASAIEIRDGRP